MAEYLKIQINGQITLSPAICRAANIKEGDMLEAVVEEDGSIHLIPMDAETRKLMEQSQLGDINWALTQKLD